MQIPDKVKLIRKKLSSLKDLVKGLKAIIDTKELCIMCNIGYYTYLEVIAEATRLIQLNDLPNGVSCERRELFDDYIRNTE